MELIEVRRSLMSAENYYVRNGLVLWMDGIDKGDVAGAWVDKAAGHTFTNENGFYAGSNYVELDGTQYFKNNTFSPIYTSSGTIEVVISDYSPQTIVFVPYSIAGDTQGWISFGVRSSGNEIIWDSKYSGANVYNKVNFESGAKIFSINYDVAITDGNDTTYGSQSYWANKGSYNYIGCRYNTSLSLYYVGKIYSIRIYNRKLARSEMLHNQRIDNKRFHLGLNI